MKNGMAQAPLIAAMGHETPRLTWRTLESRTWPCAAALVAHRGTEGEAA